MGGLETFFYSTPLKFSYRSNNKFVQNRKNSVLKIDKKKKLEKHIVGGGVGL